MAVRGIHTVEKDVVDGDGSGELLRFTDPKPVPLMPFMIVLTGVNNEGYLEL